MRRYWDGRGWAKETNRVQSTGENGDCSEAIKGACGAEKADPGPKESREGYPTS